MSLSLFYEMKSNLKLKRSTPCIVAFLLTVLSIDAELIFAPEMGPRGGMQDLQMGPPGRQHRGKNRRANVHAHQASLMC
ncbi:hypothetical protein EDB89DRAFT_449498 [Lactarius sanguifluus]|nr:hypothetical protein EDB89DRAFT_449498 [Lactarius sanguifluus]